MAVCVRIKRQGSKWHSRDLTTEQVDDNFICTTGSAQTRRTLPTIWRNDGRSSLWTSAFLAYKALRTRTLKNYNVETSNKLPTPPKATARRVEFREKMKYQLFSGNFWAKSDNPDLWHKWPTYCISRELLSFWGVSLTKSNGRPSSAFWTELSFSW